MENGRTVLVPFRHLFGFARILRSIGRMSQRQSAAEARCSALAVLGAGRARGWAGRDGGRADITPASALPPETYGQNRSKSGDSKIGHLCPQSYHAVGDSKIGGCSSASAC